MTRYGRIFRCTAMLFVLIMLAATFSSCTDKHAQSTTFSMGSVVDTKVYSDDEEAASELLALINEAVTMTDMAFSATNEGSELYALNKDGIVYGSQFFKETLGDAVMLCNILERKVDLTLGNVTSLWGFSSDSPSVPDKNALNKALEAVDIEKILIDSEYTKVTIEDDITLDFGAFGKGAACDAVYDAMFYKNVPYIVSVGGTVVAFGKGPSGGKWSVGIRNPFSDASDYFAVISRETLYPKNALFISTSGSYEKTFTENGKEYHHILDPETGYPVENDLISVTVLANSGLQADALSTALYVMGLNEKSLSVLDIFNAEAVFVFKDKTYYVTDGLKDFFRLRDKSFSETENTYETTTNEE